jgi:hypothetical protein
VARKLAQPRGNGEWVRVSWSAASLARPTAGRHHEPKRSGGPPDEPRCVSYRDAQAFRSASECYRAHKKRGVATPVGLASEAALHRSHRVVSSIGHLEVPIPLDMPLADNFPAAVDEEKFAEFVVFVFEIDGPIATSGSGGIGAPG